MAQREILNLESGEGDATSQVKGRGKKAKKAKKDRTPDDEMSASYAGRYANGRTAVGCVTVSQISVLSGRVG